MTDHHAGWTNHPTWNAALWIANDSPRLRVALERYHAGASAAEILVAVFPAGETPDGVSIAEADAEEILARCIIPRASPDHIDLDVDEAP